MNRVKKTGFQIVSVKDAHYKNRMHTALASMLSTHPKLSVAV